MAQGAGNTVCGLLGALPMTAVIVRSAANVQAGARTRLSRILYGVWLLLFAALLPGALGVIVRLPCILDTLERVPAERAVKLVLSALRHLDHACMSAPADVVGPAQR